MIHVIALYALCFALALLAAVVAFVVLFAVTHRGGVVLWLRLHYELLRLRIIAHRHGMPDYTNAAIMLGFLARERVRWTGETYEDAARGELWKVRGRFRARDVAVIERWLTGGVDGSAGAGES